MLIPNHLLIKDTDKKGKGIFAAKPIQAGQKILSLSENAMLLPNDKSSVLAIQIDDDLYLESKPSSIWTLCNHNCEPNAMIDSVNFLLISIRDIAVGEEITFHYCTTEFDLLSKNEAFSCLCGSKICIGLVAGYRHLSTQTRNDLKPYVAKYLLKQHL